MAIRIYPLSRRQVATGLASSLLIPFFIAELKAQPVPIKCKVTTAKGRLWVGVEIEGEGPFPFVIDTGAHLSLIEEATARRLKLRTVGNTRINGVGGIETFPVYATRDVVIGGGIRDKDVVFAATKFRVSSDAIGTLSAGIMTQLDSDLDFPAGEWRLYPDGRPSHEGFTQVNSDITHVGSPEGSAYIFAKVAVNGVQTDLIVDTGAPGQLYLRSSATKRLGLWDDRRPYSPTWRRGIGGEAPRLSRIVRADTVQIGDVLFQQPLVTLDDPDHGTSSRLREGIIGLALLERMTLSTDVRTRKLWVRRASGTKPYEDYNISGLWLSEEKGRVMVADVGHGSPAKAAGVRIGDEVKGLEFRSAIRHVNQPIGSLIQLKLERDGNLTEIQFQQTPYL